MRQARIRRLRKEFLCEEDEGPVEPLLTTPYFIGRSQNKPVDLAPFLTANRYDPTTTVSAPLDATQTAKQLTFSA